jgi:nucleoid-associated protein YgaU
VTERGSPPDASLACPFVAFDDDRDARSETPDHRHRCFAEVRPAPRAIAHQERYCLSPGFAACPTFLDWARREAARVAAPARSAAPEAGLAAAAAATLGPDDGPPTVAGGPTDDAPDVWPRRPGDRGWAAPPPWTSAPVAASGLDAPTTDRPASDAGEAPAFLASREPTDEPRPARPPDRPPSRLPPEAAPPSRSAAASAGAAAASGAGLAASYPGQPDVPGSVEDEPLVEPQPEMRRFGPAPSRSKEPPPTAARTEPRQRPAADPGAPPWERPRRFEAYPTLKTRAGLPDLSPIVLAVGGVVIAALALFFIPPMLLGLGGDDGPSPSPSIAASPSATAAASPSPSPSPTPLVYVVQSGDTLSKIAAQFGVSLDDLIAANQETIPNPDNIQVGDQLVIPTPAPDVIPGASPSAGASASPSP